MAHGQKTGGRAAGTPNKANAHLKERIHALIEDRFDTIVADLETLEPKERVAAFLKFLEYVLPKQREQRIDLSTLSDEQIDDLLNKALNKLN
ncbi:hypothetical protein [uncultured Spirosoma sp.]|uniref:hypothetical protein n=1 Tax=uncultured Spirosoma sp. TaxID=278208 RepID=UPI00258C7B9E|nr:hypothetical protein [uncultured Spirosoma sp.]